MLARAWTLLALLMLAAGGATPSLAAPAYIVVEQESPQLRFAIGDVEAALKAGQFDIRRDAKELLRAKATGQRVLVQFWTIQSKGVLQSALIDLKPIAGDIAAEGFSLRRIKNGDELQIHVFANDAAGAMYGALELAEQIRTRGVEGVSDTDRNPYMPLRGTKFNIPLDLRTPSYSDMSDSAQANIATVWDFEFWRAYLDQLARDRYNYVSLWNLHPFPSMVQVPTYPDVALNDVWRTRAALAEDYTTRTTDLLSPGMLANKEVVRRLTMAQKIAFWRKVMQYAHDRNISFYVITWNIFTYGVDGKYGITDALDNPKTIDYFRASVREMFHTYPLLAGIGLTAGENMGEVKMYSGGVDSFDAKENWLLATYGQGVLDAARAEPGRRFTLIHRQHESRAQDIAATFKPVIDQPNVNFVFSFKYAQAHALSSTTQTYHRGYVESLGPLKTLWTLRNDDALMFRWAAPDFVREFVGNIPREPSAGYYIGSDMWVWGREFLAKATASKGAPRQLEIAKHWLHFLLWGRMGYDPTLDNERIAAIIGQRFAGIDGKRLLSAWQDASMIYPLVTGFHWADFDFQWYIEGCRSRPGPAKTASGFHSVETFIDQRVHPGTDNITIPEFVAGERGGTSPLQVADRIDARADAALSGLKELEKTSNAGDTELGDTLADIRAMALLGKYYAAKIRGATSLARFRARRDTAEQREAIRHLKLAQGFWSDYTTRTGARYRNPLWTNRVGHVDWRELDSEVANDIALASAPLP
ncbi:MAG: Carbohydrate binding family 6 [Steroidobacteraceae bacterium]|jgi:hypothetical protein|nr:Carbohydrate binding family 6 [Steroidobacteraceae bacterium]